MTNFANAMKQEAAVKRTENGAMAYNTTFNDLLDLFSCIGALRSHSEDEIESKFARAFAQNNLLATKMLFYCGDIRNGGLGERRTFRICLKWLALNAPEIVIKNMENIPYYNRYDSLFTLVDTSCEEAMWDFVNKILYHDLLQIDEMKKGEKPNLSLLAKWMPSENASSKATKALARKAIQELGMTPRHYRKMLSLLRSVLDVTEVKMAANQWDKIKYEAVPSYAMKRYSKAFSVHDMERFHKYIQNVNDKTSNVKINASTLYPYDLVHDVFYGRNIVAQEQWEALPNYVNGANDILVMADVSGSMYGRPLETSIGLAIYFAERNEGHFHNLYMTFTDKPHFVALNDFDSLAKKVEQVINTDVGYNTNLEAAFNKILNTAIQYNMTNEDLPKALCVISDMEIDRYIRFEGLDFVKTMRLKFEQAGYNTMPKLILWNVEARNDTFLTQDSDVIKVSGQSASVFKRLCGCLDGKTDVDFMLETLNDEVYDRVII